MTDQLLAAIKAQTDSVVTELEAYRRGYLNALSFVTQKIGDIEKINNEPKVTDETPVSTATR